MFTTYSKPYDRLLRAALSLAYAFVLFAGLSTVTFTPRTIEGAMGGAITFLWASLAIIGGGAGLWGVIKNQWRIEYWASPLASSAVFCYGLAVWSLTISETVTRLTQANFIGATVLLLVYRSLELAAQANKDRKVRRAEITTLIQVVGD